MKQADGHQISNRERAERWAVEFPYGWDADDAVSRRHLLRWAVMASGALFAATAGLAGLGFLRDRRTVQMRQIVSADELEVGGVHYFDYPGQDNHAILLRLTDDRFVAYSGKCTHLSCAVYWNSDRQILHCPCHEGVFEPETGDPIAGPPTRPLPKIAVRQDNGVIYALEETP
jgi:Rieske Fe-S protein